MLHFEANTFLSRLPGYFDSFQQKKAGGIERVRRIVRRIVPAEL